MRTSSPLLAPVFRSDAQARLLAAIFLAEESEASISALARGAGVSYPTAHREVVRLVEAGILAERRVGQARIVRPNGTSPLVSPLRELILVSTGPVPALRKALGEIDRVRCAFVFGSFAARAHGVPGGPPNDVDVMVIGDQDPAEVYEVCRTVSAEVKRPVNPTILTGDEWVAGSGFISHVRESPTLHLFGETP